MTPVYQTVKHDPASGISGDCVRACVASIFDLPSDQVPHFMERGEEPPVDGVVPWQGNLRRWLNDRGFEYFMVVVKSPAGHWAGSAMQFHHIRAGRTRRDTPHAVVYFGDKMVHDPMQDDGLLDVYPQSYIIIVKR